MLSRLEQNNVTWIDLESPTRDEVESLIDEFNIDVHIADELLLPSGKPRLERYESYLYAMLRFPALRHSHKTREQEVDFIVGADFIITAHRDMIDPLHKFSKVLEVNTVLETSNVGEHAGFMFYYIMKKLYKAVEHEVDCIRHELSLIEENIFSGREVDSVMTISQMARDILNIRQSIEPHRDVLRSLEIDGVAFFGSSFAPQLKLLSNEYYRLHNHVMREMESLHELRETNNSLLTTKQNETMRIFTILAFVTFPLSLIANVFSIDSVSNPIKGHPNDFWMLLGIMITVSIGMFLYFRHKKWL